MIVDNFEQIKGLLKFESEDDFYHLQIIKRKKDNPDATGRNNNARCIKTYYITSIEYLDNKKEEIIGLCNTCNARACINLNRRSFRMIAFQTLQKITNQIMSGDYKSTRRAYEHVCGVHSSGPKVWIIDIDKEYTRDLDAIVSKIGHIINNYCTPIGNKVITTIPTVSGIHIISKPFDTKKFYSLAAEIDIHKDNPTLLYFDKKDV